MPLLEPSPNVLLTELSDGTGVLLDLDSLFYFTLNETGVIVWRAVAGGQDEASAIAKEIATRFEVDEARAAQDIEKLLAELSGQRLLVRKGPMQ